MENIEEKCNIIAISDEVYNKVAGALLKAFDDLCQKNNIEYFAFGKLLTGCIHYEGFIPGQPQKCADIGLVRSEYNKLLPILKEQAAEYGIIFDEKVGKTNEKKLIVQIGKNIYLDTPEIHIEKTIWMFISPFDKVPAARDYQYGQFHRMNLLNEKYKMMVGLKTIKGLKAMLSVKLSRLFGGPKALYDEIQSTASKYNNTDSDVYVRVVHAKSERITHDQIYPITRRKFMDFEISTPHDFSPWTVVMDDALRHQIASIQQADLEILKEFDAVCKKLGIGYFVCGGTMLGYVRHGGFIPWDDDIDIGMLRADYDRFLKEAGPHLSDRLFLQTRQSDPKIPYLFSKIRMNNTEYITEYNDGRDFHKGICMDLFPFDYIPNDYDAQMAFKDEVLKKAKIHNKITNMCIPEPEDGPCANFEEFVFRMQRKIRRAYYRRRSLTKSQERYIKVATRYNGKAKEMGLNTVASFVPGYTYVKLDDLLPYRDVIFEGVPAKVPNRPEVFLTMQYGDYMELPLKHQQVGHPLIRWSVDTTKDNNEPESEVKS